MAKWFRPEWKEKEFRYWERIRKRGALIYIAKWVLGLGGALIANDYCWRHWYDHLPIDQGWLVRSIVGTCSILTLAGVVDWQVRESRFRRFAEKRQTTLDNS
jgi:hypothetical protein